MKVRAVTILGGLMQVIILFDELFQLTLYIGDLVGWELILVQGNTGMLEVSQEAKFAREKEEETFAFAAATSCSTHTVDIVARIIRRVELHNPVHRGNVQTTGRHIRTQ